MAIVCTMVKTKKGNVMAVVGEVENNHYTPLSRFIFNADDVESLINGKIDKLTKAEFKPKEVRK